MEIKTAIKKVITHLSKTNKLFLMKSFGKIFSRLKRQKRSFLERVPSQLKPI